MKGRLIVLEGIDGSGKSTQARLLAEWLEQAGHLVTSSREPTQGPAGCKLRRAAVEGRLAAAKELMLFEEDRHEHVITVIAPALAAGHIVLLDRYYFSTMAYQGARGIDPAAIRMASEAFAPVPDLVLVLDIEVAASLARIVNRGGGSDHFEDPIELVRCRQIFLSLAEEPFVRIVEAGDSPGKIQSRIRDLVAAIL